MESLAVGAAVAAREERWRKLQEYLAAKGKLKHSSTKPYLKDKTHQQNLAPRKPELTVKGKKTVLSKTAKVTQARETRQSAPAGKILQARTSVDPVAHKSQVVSTALPGKGTGLSKQHSKQSNAASSAKGPICQARGPERRQPRPRVPPVTSKGCVNRTDVTEGLQAKAGCEKENFGTRAVAGLKKKGTYRRNPHLEPQAASKNPTKGSRWTVGLSSGSDIPVKRHTAMTQDQDQPRGRLAVSKSAQPQQRSSGAFMTRPSSGPVARRQGSPPRGPKQAMVSAGRLKDRQGNAAPPKGHVTAAAAKVGQSMWQARTRQTQKHPDNPRALKSGSAAAQKGTAKPIPKRLSSASERNQSSRKLGKKSPCLSAHCTAQKTASRGPERSSSKTKQLVTGTGEPKTPCTLDRRKLLEQWVKSHGKSYKRPSMVLPAKKPRKATDVLSQSFRSGLEEDRERIRLTEEIGSTLAACLKLAEEGCPSEKLLPTMSVIPGAEKFAKFWICKAKLQARCGPFDAVGLYEAALRAGAVPIQELRDAIVDILRNATKPVEGKPAEVDPFFSQEQTEASPQLTLPRSTSKPVSTIKLQVAPLFRAKEQQTVSGLRILTPVRRSLRIKLALDCYPHVLRDHDPVVSSLDELMEQADEGSQFVFRKNDALPEEVHVELLGL